MQLRRIFLEAGSIQTVNFDATFDFAFAPGLRELKAAKRRYQFMKRSVCDGRVLLNHYDLDAIEVNQSANVGAAIINA